MPREWGYDRDGDAGDDGTGKARWLITYADLITLLLVFFIVMYATAIAPKCRNSTSPLKRSQKNSCTTKTDFTTSK
jgi:flagellar motor protein MotB